MPVLTPTPHKSTPSKLISSTFHTTGSQIPEEILSATQEYRAQTLFARWMTAHNLSPQKTKTATTATTSTLDGLTFPIGELEGGFIPSHPAQHELAKSAFPPSAETKKEQEKTPSIETTNEENAKESLATALETFFFDYLLDKKLTGMPANDASSAAKKLSYSPT